MDLSKVYDFLPHDLSFAKLGAYGFDRSSLRLLIDYLNSRKQQTNVGSSCSKWCETEHKMPQGSILEPFNIQYIYKRLILCHYSDICNLHFAFFLWNKSENSIRESGT